MGHPDQTPPVEDAEPHRPPSRTVAGRPESTLRALDRAMRSGLLAGVAGVVTLTRAVLAYRRGRRARALVRGLVGAGWLAAALAQRRARRGRRGRPTARPAGVQSPGTGDDRGGDSTTTSGHELTERGGPPGQASDGGGREGTSDADQADVVGQDIEPAELDGMTDQPEESGDDHDHGATSSPPRDPEGTVDDG